MKLLFVAMELAHTAPGVVFGTFLADLVSRCDITVLCPSVPCGLKRTGVKFWRTPCKLIGWGTEMKIWRRRRDMPYNRKWAHLTYSLYASKIKKEGFDAVVSMVSNGFYASLDLGNEISRETGLKWIIHSVDALPSPKEWMEGELDIHEMLSANLDKLCAGAGLFLLSNPYMIDYERTKLPSFRGRFDYLYTPWRKKEVSVVPRQHGGLNILYAGRLYGLRRIDGLLEGFRQFRLSHPDARLIFAGRARSAYRNLAKQILPEGNYNFLPYSDDISSLYENADILLDIAADIKGDVFLSSKIVNYLPIPLPVVCIAGEDSASEKTVSGIESIICCRNDAGQICAAFERALSIKDYSDRAALASKFSPEQVAEEFIEKIVSLQNG